MYAQAHSMCVQMSLGSVMSDSPGKEVKGHCEAPAVGAGNWTHVLWRATAESSLYEGRIGPIGVYQA